MRFDYILGEGYQEEIRKCEEKLSTAFVDLSVQYDNRIFGTKMGGDIVIYQLVYSLPHYADTRGLMVDAEEKKLDELVKNKEITEDEKDALVRTYAKSLGDHILYTAATNGKFFYWAPQFINKLSNIGIRLVIGHEAWHSLYMHPSRRGSRHPSLWNIAVDFKVNFTLMDDLRLRGFHNASDIFKKELGDYVSFEEYAAFLKDPFNPPQKLEHWNPMHSMKAIVDPSYAPPKNGKSLFFADSKLSEDFQRPEHIYDYLINQIPKCKDCSRQPAYDLPEEYRALVKQAKKMKQDKQNVSIHQI